MKPKILRNSLKKIISPIVDEFTLCTYAYYRGFRQDDLNEELIKTLYEDKEYLSYINEIKSLVKEYEILKKG